MKKIIKKEIDNELVQVIGKAFAHLQSEQYQHREQSARFIYDVIVALTDEFDDVYNKIDAKLDDGQDLSTLDALMNDEDNISKMNLMQSLYSNINNTQFYLK